MRDYNHLFDLTSMKSNSGKTGEEEHDINRGHCLIHYVGAEFSSSSHKHCRDTDVLHCVALKQAVWILWLQRLLVLHRAEPPGVINDAAEPHTWGELSEDRLKHERRTAHNNEHISHLARTNLAASCAL